MKSVAIISLLACGLCSCHPTVKFYSVPHAVFVTEDDAERFIGETTEIVIIQSEKEQEDGR